MGFLRRFGVKRAVPKPKPRNGAVVWTLRGGADRALAALPALRTRGRIQYVSGGLGKAEADSFKLARSRFPLALDFVQTAAQPDESIADVDVNVIDHSGKSVLTVRTDGPYLLARLPDGEYTVTATYFGHTLEKTVRVVGNASARAVFVWEMKL